MRTYVITGAGSGIGRAITQQLAHEGHRCILIGRNTSTLKETIRGLDGPHQLHNADIRSLSSMKALAAEIGDHAVDGIMANAGIGGENHWGEQDRWQEILDTNLTGTYNLVNTLLPNLKRSEEPFKHIIITSSVLARLGVENYSAYCASKAGLLGLMRSWAVQYAPDNILVNAICPGWVNTEMSAEGMRGIAAGLGITREEFHGIAMQSVPLRKMSQPEEIGQLISFMLNQRSITGQAIDINNGAVMNS
jgi:NAD(P)-dependent dehydrogenase (short-subunit alcohol dehydrogenase family)